MENTITKTNTNAMPIIINPETFETFENVRGKLFAKLVNAEKNPEKLVLSAHVLVPGTDWALTANVLLQESPAGLASAVVSPAMCTAWNIPVQSVIREAVRNSAELYPLRVQSLGGMLFGLENDETEDSGGIVVITNTAGINGAAAVFYPEVIRRLYDRCGGEFYILPSSIHELLAVPDTGINPEELAAMVREINAGIVDERDQLSDHVYKFNAKRWEFEIVA